MESVYTLLAFVAAHPVESAGASALAWMLASLTINAFLSLFPPPTVVAWCERHRAGAFVVRVMRDAGVNPEAVIRFVQAAFAARAARAAAATLPAAGGGE